MSKYIFKKINNQGLTVVEIIMTIAILGVLIVPLMSMFITAAKFNKASSNEFKSVQLAQNYMEEIKSMEELNTGIYIFNSDTGNYERIVSESDDDYGAEITITPDGLIYYIRVAIIRDGEIVSVIEGSKINYE